MTLVRIGFVRGRGRGSSLAVMKEHPFPEDPFPGAGGLFMSREARKSHQLCGTKEETMKLCSA